MARTVVYNNDAEVLGVYIAEVGMFTFDITLVIILLILGLILKDRSYRTPMWVCAGLYLVFALGWHTYPIAGS